MMGMAVEIFGRDGESYPSGLFDLATREALRDYCAQRWPLGRRKAIETEWSMTPEQARSVMEGTPSASTIDAIWKHPNGGWRVALPILREVIGHGLDEWIAQEQLKLRRENARNERHQEQLAQLAGDLRSALGVGARERTGVRSFASRASGDSPGDDGDRGDPKDSGVRE